MWQWLNIFPKFSSRLRRLLGITDLTIKIDEIKNNLIDINIRQILATDAKYKSAKNLNRFEQKVFSQFGEDGILTEIFKRIGIKNHFFVEIGAGDGLENNTAYRLISGWKGIWIEADKSLAKKIADGLNRLINGGRLVLISQKVTAQNIERILIKHKTPKQFDLLSIDIDGNDYYVWEAIKKYQPRVVVIEYNATLGPDVEWTKSYDPKFTNNGTADYGASLVSLTKLARLKGYELVGCGLAGVNAFFVRKDLLANKFQKPFTAQFHYEPVRHHLYTQRGNAKSYSMFEAT